jgi:hypothetical protein
MRISNKYWKIAKRLQTQQLQRISTEQPKISEKDLFQLDIGRRGGSFFLGFYSEEGIQLALTKYGIYDDLRGLGFTDILTEIDTDDPYKHRITFYYQKKQQQNLLVDLVVRKYHVRLKMPFESPHNGKSYLGLKIDWLNLQNIRASFTEERPRLPGQKFPGLGMSLKVVELLMIICWRLNLSAIVNIPEHYHNAYLYSRIFYYIEPEVEALFCALKSAFKKYPLHKISWGIDWECVIDLETGVPLNWITSEQIIPINKELKEVFSSKKYKDYITERAKGYRFEFDEEKYHTLKQQISQNMMEKTI